VRSFRMPPALAFVGTLILTLNTLHAQQLDPARYARLQYRHLGPEGNRASAVAGEPGNPMVAYIGAASGGVWKSADGGVTWKPTFDDQTAQAIGALAVSPSAPNVVWAGTGETFIIRPPTSPGNGIYKSTDAGETWRHMGLDASGHIGRILVHPRDAEVVYACVLGHAYGPQEERGVYRTTDGGTTWARVLFVDRNTGCSDLPMDATDPGVLVAGMWQFEIKPWNLNSGGPGSGVFITRDGGDTWTRLVGHGLPKAGVNLTGAREDSFRAPMRLYGRLATLLSDVAENGADFPPTTQQLSVHDVLHARLDAAARAFETWVTTDLARFRRQVRDADLPDIVP
jgi:photosystem II stability/assembly factor-like uncharacterized protein